MKPNYIQVDCIEGDKPDFHQVESVSKFKPDIIILEYPNNELTPNTEYNNYTLDKKPLDLIQKQKESLEKVSKDDPWVASDIAMWENIAKLWKGGKNCLVYRCDAPRELVNKWHVVWGGMYPSAVHNWLWWVQIYLREKYMAKNVDWIFSQYKGEGAPTVLVFLQSFHWRHVNFLLKNPTREREWEYYFGKRFKNLTPQTIEEVLKEENRVFLKYWNKISRFR